MDLNWTEVVTGLEARKKIIEGVNILADAVKSTLGPNGHTVFMDTGMDEPRATQDGVSVAKVIRLGDPLMNMGAQAMKQVANNAENNAGDGTTTATLIAQSLINMAMDVMDEKTNVSMFKEGMNEASRQVCFNLERIAQPVKNDEDGKKVMKHIANISANGDAEIADKIMEALEIVGEKGAIKIDMGKLNHSIVKKIEGLSFSSGLISRHFATDKKTQFYHSESTKRPYIFLTDHNLEDLDDISSVLKFIYEGSDPIVLISPEFSSDALKFIFRANDINKLGVVPVQAPGFGSEREKFLEDIAIMTGAVPILKEMYPDLAAVKKMDLSEILGRCDSFSASMTEFTIFEGDGNKNDIKAHMELLLAQIEEEDDGYMKDQLSARIAKMTTGMAVIFVGGHSDLEAGEQKDRFRDALNAVRGAAEKGVVQGGGTALIRVSDFLRENGKKPINDDSEKGYDLVLSAIRTPFEQILINAGMDPFRVYEKAKPKAFKNGYDVKNKKYGDMYEMGILDSAKVQQVAVSNAVSVSGTLLTTSCAIYMTSGKTETKSIFER